MIDGFFPPPKPAIITPKAPELMRSDEPRVVIPAVLIGGLGVKALGDKRRRAGMTLGPDATGGQTFTAESSTAGHDPSLAFDDSASTWWGNTTADQSWIQVQFGVAKAIGRYTLTADTTSPTRCPSDFTLKASNTGSFTGEEVTLDTQTGQSWTAGEKKTFNISNVTSYTYYRINMTAKADALGKATEYIIAEIEMMAYV